MESKILSASTNQIRPYNPWRAWGLQVVRVLIFVGIVGCLHLSARTRATKENNRELNSELSKKFQKLSGGFTVGEPLLQNGLLPVFDGQGQVVKYLATTSPDADHIIGFSGPTNVLIAFDLDMQVTGLEVLWSRDTREHLSEVENESEFWNQFIGLKWEELAQKQQIDAVSGATLTSFAIGESLIKRFGGEIPSLRFPEPLTVTELHSVFPEADSLEPSPLDHHAWDVFNKDSHPLGFVLSTSPVSDDIVGYQGPTRTLIVLKPNGKVHRIHVLKSYDNQPYVSYLNEDWYWPELFHGLSLQEVAEFSLEEQGVEGVSGATFTSMAVAKGVIKRARQAIEPTPEPVVSKKEIHLTPRDWGTLSVIFFGAILAMTHLRGVTWLRVVFQFVLIGYVGLINGDLLSQAMFVGWAQNGVPWQSAISLVVLASVAFLLPVTTKKNVYCSHLCAHGAVQQLVRNRLSFQLHPSRNVKRFLKLIPLGLLIWVIIVSVFGLSYSLVDIEPFDAYLFQIAGWSAITIAIVGIVASLFVPMAYCRFGCPTGTLLEFLRRTGRSDRLSLADGLALLLLILAIVLYVTSAT